MKQADIYINDLFCGILTEDEEGYHFVYDDFYLKRPEAAPAWDRLIERSFLPDNMKAAYRRLLENRLARL
ncbi:MAG: hypothetical protein J5695_06770 [Bacteroidales bacterium]|nr:hypothetical protein [Bacteroidales bacterium]